MQPSTVNSPTRAMDNRDAQPTKRPMTSNPADPGWTRREWLCGVGSAWVSLSSCRARTKRRRPNVLFVMPDQMRGQALGCMGDPNVKTPNLDRLASQGILFRHTYANSPVCSPARAILQTGLYCHRNGMVANDLRLREDHITVAEMLAKQGYRTGFIGKWHLDGGPRLPGYVPPGPRRQGYQFWAANECNHNHFRSQYFRDTPAPIPISRFETEVWTDLALEFLEQSRKDNRPFFLTVQMGPPHDPYRAPESYEAQYDPARIQLRPNWKPGPGVPGPKEIASYYAMIASIDDQVGRLMRALDEFGMTEDTIVLFSSDHGDMLGSHGQRLKRKPWEESVLVPGILRYPKRVKPGRIEDVLISHVDFVPTLLALCDVTPEVELQGTDLSKLVLGEKSETPDAVLFQIFGPYQGDGTPGGWRGLRTHRYKYARFRERPWVLYDLEQDPYELHNLVSDPSAQKLLGELDKQLEAFMARVGDSWNYNWTHPVEDRGRLYRWETFYTVEEYLAWAKEHPELDQEPQSTQP